MINKQKTSFLFLCLSLIIIETSALFWWNVANKQSGGGWTIKMEIKTEIHNKIRISRKLFVNEILIIYSHFHRNDLQAYCLEIIWRNCFSLTDKVFFSRPFTILTSWINGDGDVINNLCLLGRRIRFSFNETRKDFHLQN